MIRPSDLFTLDSSSRSSELLGLEFSAWCSAAFEIWKADDRLKSDFASVVEFFDWSFAVAEKLIRSAENFKQ